MCVCAHTYVCMCVCECRCQPVPMEAKTLVLGTELVSSRRAAITLNHRAISLAPINILTSNMASTYLRENNLNKNDDGRLPSKMERDGKAFYFICWEWVNGFQDENLKRHHVAAHAPKFSVRQGQRHKGREHRWKRSSFSTQNVWKVPAQIL